MSNLLLILCTVVTASSFSFSGRVETNGAAARMVKVAANAAVISCVLLSNIPASAGDVGAGEKIFKTNCAACHPGGQNVIMPEKTLQKEALEQFLAGGMSEESVVRQVSNGKNAMPAFGGRLPEEEIENVASFVIKSSKAGWD